MVTQATAAIGSAAQEGQCGTRVCPLFHDAIELVGKKWTGAIVRVLSTSGPLRFGEIAHAVPELSDRLLSERIKELEAHGIVERCCDRTNATYKLTAKGQDLEPALREIAGWAKRWLEPPSGLA